MSGQYVYIQDEDCIIDAAGAVLYVGLRDVCSIVGEEVDTLVNLLNNGYDELEFSELDRFVQSRASLQKVLEHARFDGDYEAYQMASVAMGVTERRAIMAGFFSRY